MSQNKEFHSHAFSTNPRFNYLPDQDRYLLAKTKPRYKLNLIGAGIIGQEHLHLTYMEGRAIVHGVYDPNPRSVAMVQELNALYSDAELVVYGSLEEACHDPAVDALIICTPNYTHLEVVQVAAQSGKHILLEKPISTTVPSAYEIVRIAEATTAVFQIGLQYRYKAMYTESRYEALTRKTLGEIKQISIQEHRIPFLDKVNQWNKFAKYSGDTLIEKCCHYFDLLNLFAQSRAVSVYASGNMAVNFKTFEYNGEKSDILDNALVIVTYANGVRAQFNLCMFAPLFYEELVLCGDEGRLKAWERQDFVSQLHIETEMEIACGEERPSRHQRLGYPAHIERSGHSGATYYEHMAFIDQIEGRETVMATPREGLWSVIVAAAAQESIQTGQVIQVADYLQKLGLSELATE